MSVRCVLAFLIAAVSLVLPVMVSAELDTRFQLQQPPLTHMPSLKNLPFSLGDIVDVDAASRAAEAAEAKLKALEAEQREIQDLIAQEAMAWWAGMTGWVGIASAVAATIAVFVTLRSLKETRTIADKQLSPYLHVAKAEFGETNNVVLTIANGGQTPASQFMVVNASACLVDQDKITDAVAFEGGEHKVWSALGVSQELPVAILDENKVIAAFRRSKEKAEIMYGDPSVKSKHLLICGQIVYRGIDGASHKTQFAFYVDRRSNRLRRPVANLKTFVPLRSRRDRKWVEDLLRNLAAQ